MASTQVAATVQASGDKVLVAGSTGGVGQITVAKLTEQGFKVRALTRTRSKAQELFGSSSDIEIVEVDPREKSALQQADIYDGCQGVIICIGTTAFPSARWSGKNGPKQTDLVSAGNLIDAVPQGIKHVTYCTSAGVERYDSFPFALLNIFGVLKFKRASEQKLQQTQLSHTIVRPSRLTDGPYTSYDINTLLQATSGNRQKVVLSKEDDLTGEASRIAVAEMLVQTMKLDALQGKVLSIESEEGQGPQSTEEWRALVAQL